MPVSFPNDDNATDNYLAITHLFILLNHLFLAGIMVHYIQFHLHLPLCVFLVHNYDKNTLHLVFLKTGNDNNINYQVLEENNRGMNL